MAQPLRACMNALVGVVVGADAAALVGAGSRSAQLERSCRSLLHAAASGDFMRTWDAHATRRYDLVWGGGTCHAEQRRTLIGTATAATDAAARRRNARSSHIHLCNMSIVKNTQRREGREREKES